MNTFATSIALAAVLVVAVAACQSQPGNGGSGGQPTTSQSSSPALLASGTFKAKGAPVELDAAGAGDSVTGTMTVSGAAGDTLFAVGGFAGSMPSAGPTNGFRALPTTGLRMPAET